MASIVCLLGIAYGSSVVSICILAVFLLGVMYGSGVVSICILDVWLWVIYWLFNAMTHCK